MDIPVRYFRLKNNRAGGQAEWLNRKGVYEGKLISMTNRVVRLFAPDPTDRKQHVDVSYDWVTPVR